jgi:hypothetical protein
MMIENEELLGCWFLIPYSVEAEPEGLLKGLGSNPYLTFFYHISILLTLIL